VREVADRSKLKSFNEYNEKSKGRAKPEEDLKKPEDFDRISKERYDKFKSKDLCFAPRLNEKV